MGWAPLIQTGFHVSGRTWERRRGRDLRFCLQDYHLLWFALPDDSTNEILCNSPTGTAFPVKHRPSTPPAKRMQTYMQTVWAVPLSLAATEGIDYFLSVPELTEMFHFGSCRNRTLCVQVRTPRKLAEGCPIGNPRI